MDLNKFSNIVKEQTKNENLKEKVEKGKSLYDQYLPEKIKDQVQVNLFHQEEKLLDRLESGMKENDETRKFREFLNKPLKWSTNDRKAVKEEGTVSPEIIGVGAVTFADYFYSMSQIDPNVVKAIDFSRADTEFDTFEDVRNYVSIEFSSLASEGSIQNIKGYTGEQIVSEHLKEQGYSVEFPENPNQEAYDLIVNGEFIQVKNVLTPDLITEHLEKNPDIPVYAPSEMASAFEGNPMVHAVEEMSAEATYESVEGTLTGIEGLGDALLGIPVLTLATSSYRAFKKVKHSNMDVNDAIKYVAVDTVSSTAGALVGAKVGFAVGTMLAPVTGGISLVLGPALGSMMGIFVAKKLVALVRNSKVKKAYESFKEACYHLSNASLERKNQIKEFINSIIAEQRKVFRSMMMDAYSSDGTKLLVDHPSNNYIMLSEIGKRYRDDSNQVLHTRTTLSNNVLHLEQVHTDEQLNEILPSLLENRGLFESAYPDLKRYYEKVINKWQTYLDMKEKY